MIHVTQEQAQKVEDLRKASVHRGKTLQTRIVYELWPLLFGVLKRPNGCSACLRADLNQFMTKWDNLLESGELQILGQEGEEAPEVEKNN